MAFENRPLRLTPNSEVESLISALVSPVVRETNCVVGVVGALPEAMLASMSVHSESLPNWLIAGHTD